MSERCFEGEHRHLRGHITRVDENPKRPIFAWTVYKPRPDVWRLTVGHLWLMDVHAQPRPNSVCVDSGSIDCCGPKRQFETDDCRWRGRKFSTDHGRKRYQSGAWCR